MGSSNRDFYPEDVTEEEAEEFKAPGMIRRFLLNKYQVIEMHLEGVERPVSARHAEVKARRMRRAVKHAKAALLARHIVTFFLLLAAGSTVVSAALGALEVVPAALDLVRTIAAYAAAFTIVLLVARLALDRYLAHIEAMITFLAIEIAGARRSSGRDS